MMKKIEISRCGTAFWLFKIVESGKQPYYTVEYSGSSHAMTLMFDNLEDAAYHFTQCFYPPVDGV